MKSPNRHHKKRHKKSKQVVHERHLEKIVGGIGPMHGHDVVVREHVPVHTDELEKKPPPKLPPKLPSIEPPRVKHVETPEDVFSGSIVQRDIDHSEFVMKKPVDQFMDLREGRVAPVLPRQSISEKIVAGAKALVDQHFPELPGEGGKEMQKKKLARQLIREQILELNESGPRSYDWRSLEDYNAMRARVEKYGDKVDKEQFFEDLKEAEKLGLLYFHRPEQEIRDEHNEVFARQRHFRNGQEGVGAPTVRKGEGEHNDLENSLGNLGIIESQKNGKPFVMRSAKIDTEREVSEVAKLHNESLQDSTWYKENRKKLEDGDELEPVLVRNDLKSQMDPSQGNWFGKLMGKLFGKKIPGGGERPMIEKEQRSIQQYNDEEGGRRVYYSNGATNAFGTLLGGRLLDWFGMRKSENRSNRSSDSNMLMRGILKVAKLEGQDGKASEGMRRLTSAFNRYERGEIKVSELRKAITEAKQDPRDQHFVSLFERALESSTNPRLSLSQVAKHLDNINLNLHTDQSKALRENLSGYFRGIEGDGSRSQLLSMRSYLQQDLNMTPWIGCKSGQDRTGHLVASSVAGQRVREQFGEVMTGSFFRNFDKATKLFDEGNFEQLRGLLGAKDVNSAKALVESYRKNYLRQIVDLVIPVTESSTTIPGVKWGEFGHGNNPFSGKFWSSLGINTIPLQHLPQTHELVGRDGSRHVVNVKTSKGGFDPQFFQFLTGLAEQRKT